MLERLAESTSLKARIISLVALALLLVMSFFPLISANQDTSAASEALVRLQSRAISGDGLRALHQTRQEELRESGLASIADTIEQAQEDLKSRLGKLVSTTGMSIASIDLLKPRPEHGAMAVGAKVTLSGPSTPILAGIRSIDASSPFLKISSLQMRSSDMGLGGAGPRPAWSASVTVEAHYVITQEGQRR